MNKKFLQRFAELAAQAEGVAKTARSASSGRIFYVDGAAFTEWRVKVGNLLRGACGPLSQHVAAFAVAGPDGVSSTEFAFKQCRAVFAAAKEDYEGGYLTSLAELVRAEIFDDEMEQSKALLASGYIAPAAVVAGVVLETALRGLCTKHSVATGSMDRMNAELAKAGVYTVLVQKQVVEMAHVRNKAAHGETTEYTDADVRKMVGNVGDFVAAHVGT